MWTQPWNQAPTILLTLPPVNVGSSLPWSVCQVGKEGEEGKEKDRGWKKGSNELIVSTSRQKFKCYFTVMPSTITCLGSCCVVKRHFHCYKLSLCFYAGLGLVIIWIWSIPILLIDSYSFQFPVSIQMWLNNYIKHLPCLVFANYLVAAEYHEQNQQATQKLDSLRAVCGQNRTAWFWINWVK